MVVAPLKRHSSKLASFETATQPKRTNRYTNRENPGRFFKQKSTRCNRVPPIPRTRMNPASKHRAHTFEHGSRSKKQFARAHNNEHRFTVGTKFALYCLLDSIVPEMQCTRREFTRNVSLAAAGSLLGIPLYASATNYTVKNGDTLSQIALRHGVSASALKKANHLNSDLIRVGQKLQIPTAKSGSSVDMAPGSIHEVARGDTLGGIAITHGVSVRDLKRANNLSGDVIRVGQKLHIPNAVEAEDLLRVVRATTRNIAVRVNNWNTIVVHHSAIKYGNAAIYDRAHRQRGMTNGLAYHFIIGNGIDSGDGEIEVGPRWKKQLQGGHVKSHKVNLTGIGICLVGNFEQTHPSHRQLAAFTQLMDWLRGEIIPKATRFVGHLELKGEQTLCPGKYFPLAAMHARYS